MSSEFWLCFIPKFCYCLLCFM